MQTLDHPSEHRDDSFELVNIFFIYRYFLI